MSPDRVRIGALVDEVARVAAQRDEAKAREAAVRGDLADMRALLSEVLSEFEREADWQPDGDLRGWHHEAEVSEETFERWLKLAGIEAL